MRSAFFTAASVRDVLGGAAFFGLGLVLAATLAAERFGDFVVLGFFAAAVFALVAFLAPAFAVIFPEGLAFGWDLAVRLAGVAFFVPADEAAFFFVALIAAAFLATLFVAVRAVFLAEVAFAAFLAGVVEDFFAARELVEADVGFFFFSLVLAMAMIPPHNICTSFA